MDNQRSIFKGQQARIQKNHEALKTGETSLQAPKSITKKFQFVNEWPQKKTDERGAPRRTQNGKKGNQVSRTQREAGDTRCKAREQEGKSQEISKGKTKFQLKTIDEVLTK